MKRNISKLLALVLTFVLCVPAYAADQQYTITILANNSASTTVAVGNEITVTLQLSKNGEDSFELYSMQDYVCFDPDHLQYVKGSITVYTVQNGEQVTNLLRASARALYDYGTGDINRVFINRTTTSDGVTLASGATLLTFRLKAVAQGATEITHKQVEVFQRSGNLYSVTEQTATVTIGQPKTVTAAFSGGTGASGSTASISATEGSQITLPANGFSRTGYTFSGWSDGTRTYQPGSTYTLTSVTTFTAQWTRNPANTNNDNTNGGSTNGGSTGNGGNTGSTGNTGNTGTTGSSGGSGGSGGGNTTVDATDSVNSAGEDYTTTVETAANGTVTTTNTTTDGVTGVTVTDQSGNITSVSAEIPADVATEAAKSGESVPLPIEVKAAKSTASATAIAVSVPSGAGKVNVEIPVSNVSLGVVAVKVNSDGTEEIVKTCIATDDGVELAVSGDSTVKIVDNTKTFNDVSNDHWGLNAITFTTARTIFNGTSSTTFEPEVSMSRGMLAQVLYNLENAPEPNRVTDFVDVDENVWYADAVAWAAEAGVVQGYGDGSFGPTDNITREQMVVMLWRYAGEPTASADSMNAFPDSGNVDDYAQQAMAWAVANGIINGNGSKLDPHGNATRVQVAAVAMRYCSVLAQ